MRNIALFLLLAAPLLTCARQERPQALEPNPAAEVAAVTGDARTFVNGEWSAAVVGRVLLASDSLDIPAAASCELRDAANKLVAVSGAVRDDVAKLLAAGLPVPAPAQAPLVKTLTTVKKLSAETKFQVTSPAAVAGVRGAKGRARPDTTDTTGRR